MCETASHREFRSFFFPLAARGEDSGVRKRRTTRASPSNLVVLRVIHRDRRVSQTLLDSDGELLLFLNVSFLF